MAEISIQQDQKYFIHNNLRQPYQKIGNDIREKVIYDIVFQENSIKQTALKYGLKYSTANGIVQTYQQQGRCMKKDKRNKKQCFKRNKILLIIDFQTGDLNLYQQQTTSNVLIIESSINSQIPGNYKQLDQFHHSKECTEQFIHQDIESISTNLIQWMKENMKLGQSKNNFSFNNFKSEKNIKKSHSRLSQKEIPQQSQGNNNIVRQNNQKNFMVEQIHNEKQEINKQEELHNNQDNSDSLKSKYPQYYEKVIFQDKKCSIEKQLENITKLWKQQIFLMSQK